MIEEIVLKTVRYSDEDGLRAKIDWIRSNTPYSINELAKLVKFSRTSFKNWLKNGKSISAANVRKVKEFVKNHEDSHGSIIIK